MLNKIKPWIKAFRLRTLPLSFSCILMGNALAFEKENFHWIILVFTLLTTLFLQILSNLANDYGDGVKGTDNDQRLGPTRAIQSGEISVQAMKKSIWIFSILSLFSGLYLLYIVFKELLNVQFILFFVIGVLAIFSAIKYTVGKNAYGYSGLGDVFVFIFFGWVGVLGSYFLQSQNFDFLLILPASVIGFISAAVLNLNNMRDIENDRNSNKNTIVVKMGLKNAKVYHYLLFIFTHFSFLVFLILNKSNYEFFIIQGIIFFMHLGHLVKVYKAKMYQDFDPELKKVALSAFLLSVMYGVLIFVK